MIDKKINKSELRKLVKISSSTMAKMTKQRNGGYADFGKNLCRIRMQYRRYYGIYRVG